MATVKSCPFSFVRFEDDLVDSYCPSDVKYILPVGNKHEVKFQFIIEGNLPITNRVQLGTSGVIFSPEVRAKPVDYLFQVPLTFFTAGETFHLISFKLVDDLKSYDILTTWPGFLELLKQDFNLDAYIGTGADQNLYFVNECQLAVEFIAAPLPSDVNVTMNTVNYFWHQAYVEAPDVEVTEDCFQYTIHDTGGTGTTDVPFGSTNEFAKAPLCYTSLLTYRCNENAFEFHYRYNECNQVRLPFYLSRPNFPQKRTVYVKSNGNQLVLSAQVEKEYQLRADWMIELFHECMSIALNHDEVIITSDNIRERAVSIIASEYGTEWNEEYELAYCTAKGKVKVATFTKTNSNCETEENAGCDNTSASCPVITGLAISHITTDSALATWSAAGGAAINYEIILFRADTPGTPVAGYPVTLDPGITAYRFTGLEPATDYQFAVRSNCGFGHSNWVDLPADPDFSTL